MSSMEDSLALRGPVSRPFRSYTCLSPDRLDNRQILKDIEHQECSISMDRVTSLSVFIKVVEGSSFAAAARHFALSPAMVSKHINTLEERLGAPPPTPPPPPTRPTQLA